MAKIAADQLADALKKTLSPIYCVVGDETLLVQEAADHIRVAAKKVGFIEREIFHADTGFQWAQLLQSANSLSLFSDKKIIELRLNNGKIPEPGLKILQEYAKAPSADNLLLIIGPKLDKAVLASAAMTSLEKQGVLVQAWPISPKQLPRWIEQRLARAGLKADSQAVDLLVSRVEGNLLAAAQEIEKLKLVAAEGMIDVNTMAQAVVDSARYDVFGLIDKCLSGHTSAAMANLQGLRAEGSDAIVVLWALAREIRTLLQLKLATDTGQPIDFIAKKHGVFDTRLALVKSALARLSIKQLQLLLRQCAFIDRSVKGMGDGNPWNLLQELALSLAGHRALNNTALKTALGL